MTLLRVIQMIDENKEQLRNLFRKYNVVDVQPAVSDKLPDDITTLQVCEDPENTQNAADAVAASKLGVFHSWLSSSWRCCCAWQEFASSR